MASSNTPPTIALPQPGRPSLLAQGRDSDWTRSVSLLAADGDADEDSGGAPARSTAVGKRLRGPLVWAGAVLLLLLVLIGLSYGDAPSPGPAASPVAAAGADAPAPALLPASAPVPPQTAVTPEVPEMPVAAAPELLAAAAGAAIGKARLDAGAPEQKPVQAKAAPRAAAAKTPVSRAARSRTDAGTDASREDPDVELLSALMSHQDQKTPTAKLKPAERRAFARVLKKCSAGTADQRRRCRRDACEAHAYWGRTPSCPPRGP